MKALLILIVKETVIVLMLNRGKYMAKLMKFVYVMIYFISLFLVATANTTPECFEDSQCKHIKCRRPWFPRCSERQYCKCLDSKGRGF
ncbi:hypothetical protein P8452_50741 [Trifolium repens]|nr:hypothetical protein P8452_50741 [Trifolium repens]